MKIVASLRSFYEDNLQKANKLKKAVDILIESQLQPYWHYESRVKSLESFSLKLETGRFDKSTIFEDLFACTIVVKNSSEIKQAEDMVREFFDIKHRKPNTDDFTHNSPESFAFDHVRLYVAYKDNPAGPPTGLEGEVIEVQIKTFLQHAWSIATHDLVYKTREASWAKKRIAYQIKAMLEHAEVSIQEAENVSKSLILAKSDKKEQAIKSIQKFLRGKMPEDRLPEDLLRLSNNIYSLNKAIGLNLEDFKTLLGSETSAGYGFNLLNLSPYSCVTHSLIRTENAQFFKYLSGEANRFKIFLPKELIELFDLDTTSFVNSVLLS